MVLTIFDPDAVWSAFVWTSLCSTAAITLVLAGLFRWRRHQFVKPSLQILAFYHVLGQWPGAIQSPQWEERLPEPWAALALVQGFIALGLLVSVLTSNGSARAIWRDLARPSHAPLPPAHLAALAAGLAFCTALYIHHVPLSATGLAALLVDPERATAAREESLKLLDSWVPKYAFTLASQTFAPLLVALAAANAQALWPRAKVGALAWLALLPLVFPVVMLTGAKGQLVVLVLVAAATLAWRRRLAVSPAWLLGAAALVLLPAVLVTLRLAQSGDTDYSDAPGGVIGVSIGGTLDRAFLAIGQVNLWYLDYAQTQGPVGIAGIPKLAALFGIAGVDIPNTVGLTFAGEIFSVVEETISANAGYLLAFYVYFGMWALPVSLALLKLCDLLLLITRRLPSAWLAPILACNTFGAMTFAVSDYLTSTFTHGFATRVIVVWVMATALGLAAASSRRTDRVAPERQGASRGIS